METFADLIDQTDLDLEPAFLSSEMIRMGSISENEMILFQDLNIRAILAEALPQNITFRAGEYRHWTINVADFCKLNFSHTSFAEVLAVDKNYNLVLEGMLDISASSRPIIDIVRRDTSRDMKGVFYSTISDELYASARELALEAFIPSLRRLASRIREVLKRDHRYSQKELQLQRSRLVNLRSFRDKRGTVRFGISDGLLEIQSTGQAASTSPTLYKPLMRRALAAISKQDVLRRIDNVDRTMANFIREYDEYFSREECSENALILYAVGEDVSKSLVANGYKDKDEQLGPDVQSYIEAFVLANAAYVQSFSVVRTLMDDIERTKRSFSQINEENKTIDWRLLGALSKSDGLFSDRTRETLAKLRDNLAPAPSEPSSGLTTIGLGALRGSLQAMVCAILDGALSEAAYSVKTAGGIVLKEVIRTIAANDSLQQGIIVFLNCHQEDLLELATSLPVYFMWLKTLVDILKVTTGS